MNPKTRVKFNDPPYLRGLKGWTVSQTSNPEFWKCAIDGKMIELVVHVSDMVDITPRPEPVDEPADDATCCAAEALPVADMTQAQINAIQARDMAAIVALETPNPSLIPAKSWNALEAENAELREQIESEIAERIALTNKLISIQAQLDDLT